MPTFDEMYDDLVKMCDIDNKWNGTMANLVWCGAAGVNAWEKKYLETRRTLRERASRFPCDVAVLWDYYCKPQKEATKVIEPSLDEMIEALTVQHNIIQNWAKTVGNPTWCKEASVLALSPHVDQNLGYVARLKLYPKGVVNLYNHYCKPKKAKPAVIAVDECSNYGQAIKDLFSRHEKAKWLVLYETNPEFAKAAEKLAWKLAHALATSPKGTIVRRRKSQSPTLFIAALSFLFRSTRGVAYHYTDDCIELA